MANKFQLKAIISAVDKLSPTLRGIQKNIKITKKAFGDITSAGSNLFKSAGLTGAAIGGGLFAGLKKIIDVSSDFEKFRTILETIEGSSAKADKAMAWIQDFAIKTPYELEQVTESFVKLKAYGIDPTNGSLASVGDAAAAMGKDVIQGVEALADAMTGENERLKEFGIKASKQGDKFVYSWTENGKTMVATAKANSKEQIEATITGIWNRRYGGAMDKLSGTWSGMVSNMSDQATKLIKGIGDAGIFDTLKNNLKGLLATVDRLEQNGTFAKLAKQISDDLSVAVKQLSDWASQVDWSQMYEGIKTTVAGIKDFVNAVGGLKTILIALGVVMLAGPVASMIQIAGATFTIIKALTGWIFTWNTLMTAMSLINPVTLAIAAIAGAAYLIYKNWEPIKKWFSNLWAGIKSGAETLFEYLKLFLSWSPLGLVLKAWGGVAKFFGKLYDQAHGIASSAPGESQVNLPSSGSGPGGRSPLSPRVQSMNRTQVNGEMTVKFENAPQGMRVSEGKTDSPWMKLNPDVGYRPFVTPF